MPVSLHGWLEEWGSWWARHEDLVPGEGENVLHRMALLIPRHSGYAEHKVLCAEMPRHLQILERGVERLPDFEAGCLRVRYCLPMRPDGRLWTVGQMARGIGVKRNEFRFVVRQARRDLKAVLSQAV